MKLLTQEILKQLPKIGETEPIPIEEKIMVVKFFTPDAQWTWYACEFDGEDEFFGYIVGFEKEWGYFSLQELKSIRGRFGLPIERDLYWKPRQFKDLDN